MFVFSCNNFIYVILNIIFNVNFIHMSLYIGWNLFVNVNFSKYRILISMMYYISIDDIIW